MLLYSHKAMMSRGNMTAEQKQRATVKFAEAMGYRKFDKGRGRAMDQAPCYVEHSRQTVLVAKLGHDVHQDFRPWDNRADALELADKLGLRVCQRLNDAGEWAVWVRGRGWHLLAERPDLCDAICRAALAFLEDSPEGR